MLVRLYRSSDCEILAELFYNTVHCINRRDYSEEQLNAWASGKVDLEKWNQSFLAHYSVVAETDGIIAGFGDIDRTGYLDRLYIHKDYQRQGIGAAVCSELEKAFSVPRIVTHASVTARGFFEKRGYRVIKEQRVERSGIFLANFVMELML